jgi:hypothetical protein
MLRLQLLVTATPLLPPIPLAVPVLLAPAMLLTTALSAGRAVPLFLPLLAT